MTGKDILNFLAVYVAIILTMAVLALIVGSERHLSDADHLTALVFACASTIIRAIRETHP